MRVSLLLTLAPKASLLSERAMVNAKITAVWPLQQAAVNTVWSCLLALDIHLLTFARTQSIVRFWANYQRKCCVCSCSCSHQCNWVFCCLAVICIFTELWLCIQYFCYLEMECSDDKGVSWMEEYKDSLVCGIPLTHIIRLETRSLMLVKVYLSPYTWMSVHLRTK